jgi:hypothetical protein
MLQEVGEASEVAVKEKAKRTKDGKLESRAKGMNMSMEELKALQQQKLREAAERMAANGGAPLPPGP